MSDTLSPQQRHANMAAIHGKDTKPEMIVRRWLWHHGFRYRLNHPRLPGKPDIVMRKYRTCIFVNGCIWHGHHVDIQPNTHPGPPKGRGQECPVGTSDFLLSTSIINSSCCKIPKTNREFWVAKISRNQERDREDQRKLAAMGWHCITVWECELKPKVREQTLQSLAFTLNKIFLQDHSSFHYELPEQPPMMAAEDREDLP